MIRTTGFSIHKIEDSYFLLPHGQRIAELRHGIQLNTTGVYLWNHLEDFSDTDALASAFIRDNHIETSDISAVSADVKDFVLQMKRLNLIEDTPDTAQTDTASPSNMYDSIGGSASRLDFSVSDRYAYTAHIEIADIHLTLESNTDIFSRDFDHFAVSPEQSLVCSRIIAAYEALPPAPDYPAIISNPDVIIWEHENTYQMHFPSSEGILGCLISKDGSLCKYCLLPAYEGARKLDIVQNLFHAMRFAFIYIAHLHGRYVFHSASFLYRDMAWLFTGPSGTGKSTHTNLWKKLFNVPILNGDLNILMMDESGQPMVSGLPWCGTSGIFTTGTVPLGGITILQQAPENRVCDLDSVQKELALTLRLISPTWTAEMVQQHLDFMHCLKKRILVTKLQCNMEDEACLTMKQAIDGYCLSR